MKPKNREIIELDHSKLLSLYGETEKLTNARKELSLKVGKIDTNSNQ